MNYFLALLPQYTKTYIQETGTAVFYIFRKGNHTGITENIHS